MKRAVRAVSVDGRRWRPRRLIGRIENKNASEFKGVLAFDPSDQPSPAKPGVDQHRSFMRPS